MENPSVEGFANIESDGLSTFGSMGGVFHSLSSAQIELEHLPDSLQRDRRLGIYNDYFDYTGYQSRHDPIDEPDDHTIINMAQCFGRAWF